MLSSYLPYPLFTGGHIRLYNLLKQLSKKHEIIFVCEKRDYQTQKDIDEIKNFCEKVFVVEKQKQWSVKNVLKTGFSSYPFLMIGHTNFKLKKILEELIEENKFDLIHVETSYVVQNLPEKIYGKIPVVLVEHNVEYLVYKRFFKLAPIFLKPFLAVDVFKIKRYEESFWKKATRLIAVSEDEKKLMKKTNVDVVPNGVDIDKFRIVNLDEKIKKEEKMILFIGDFRWIQNKNAIKIILKDIWPKVNSRVKNLASLASRSKLRGRSGQNSKLNLKLWVVGRNISDSIKRLNMEENVVFDENAPEDTTEIFKRSHVLLSPIRVGGGTSFKILESMASGVPVVTTTLGIEGIDAKNNEEVLISNNSNEIADLVLKILKNKNLYKKITTNARKLIEEKYAWDKIAKKLDEVYRSVVDSKNNLQVY
ncbi:MAG: glycosyltransferase family 4 protein [Patescibacteria group bacterium]|nr:glycosyltransferase family 4 protein [Patescibacteria group bacterium]